MATKAMNLAVGINFDLLKTNLSAMYEKGENGSKILLLPTKVDSTSTVSLGEMVTDFQNAFGMKDADSDKISTSLDSVKKEGSTFDPNAVTFQLQSAFLYKNSPKEGEGDLEYAIAVAVDMANALPDLGFIKLNRLYLAVWNTERTTVLKQLGTGAIDNMLKTLEA
jgi:hypothetical protein